MTAPTRESEGRRRGLVPEDLLRSTWLEALALAPSGSKLAYVARRIDASRDTEVAQLFLRDLESGAATAATDGRDRIGSLAWSRDGRRLAYVRSGSNAGASGWELVVVPVEGSGELVRLSTDGGAPTALDWAPDGRRLVCVRSTVEPTSTAQSRVPGLPLPTVRTVRRLRYKQDGVGWVPDRFRQLWLVDVETRAWTQRTAQEADHGEPRWSWDGTRIAFTVTAREQNDPLGYGQVRILDDRTGETVAPLGSWQGLAASPVWRADDGAIAFTGHEYPPPVHRRRFAHVWHLDLATGEVRDLTAHLDAQVGNYAVSDVRAGLTSVTVAWPAGMGDLWCLVTDRGRVHVHRVDASGGGSNVIVGGDGVVFAFSAAPNGALAYGWSDPRTFGDLYFRLDGATRRLEALNPWLADIDLVVPTEDTLVTASGTPVHVWEMAPGDRTSGVPFPAIVQVHCSMFSWGFSHENQCLVASGFVVQYANQFGTTAGYGQAHALGNYIGSQYREAEEILCAVEALARRSYVDPQRIGLTGGSCGGYMTNWLVTQTDRFAAAVTQRSISNLVSKFGTGDNGPEQATAEGASPPWADVETLWANSPLAHVGKVRTPILILHATDDHRCPLGQAEEWFAALRWHGVRTELVVFEGESHDLTRSGRPSNRLEHLIRMRGWFVRHLQQVKEECP